MQEGGGGGGDSMHLLLSILADGEEQARRLLGELPPAAAADDQAPLAANECCRSVARQLLCTFGKAIAVAKAIEAAHGGGASVTDSPRSADESSGVATRDATQALERQGICKRRKGLPRWTVKFRIPDASMESTPDDGLSWRKYGQKDILGAKFPRGYFRCTHRNAQGCQATRQVQRSDADLAVFDVTYQGEHTCHQKQRHAAPPPAPAAVMPAHDGGHPPQEPDVQLLASFQNGLKVDTNVLPPPPPSFHGHGVSTAAAFSFPYDASAGFLPAECGGHEHFSPASFVSPAATTSAGSGYFSVAPHCPALGTRGAPESSELAEVVSAATSAAAAGFDYSLYEYEYQLQQDDLAAFAPMFGHPSSHGQHGDA